MRIFTISWAAETGNGRCQSFGHTAGSVQSLEEWCRSNVIATALGYLPDLRRRGTRRYFDNLNNQTFHATAIDKVVRMKYSPH